MGTKNNPKNRAEKAEKRKFNGKAIVPILYNGVHMGHGKYISAKYDNSTQLVLDDKNRPMQWDQIPNNS
jgi:hypothetical protein